MRMNSPAATALTHAAIDIGIRLSDDAYMAWSIAEEECAAALRAWSEAAAGRRTAARTAYRAALDREEAAARDLERISALIARAA
jgi:hypothetical protein